jgi:cytochrome c
VLAKFKSYKLWAGLGAIAVLMASSPLSRSSGQEQMAGKHGKQLFEKYCTACHALNKDLEGPRLGGVYGREAGSVPSFHYSKGPRRFGITWADETLDEWIANPERLAPDNDMAFHLEKSNERREIIAYLKQISGK